MPWEKRPHSREKYFTLTRREPGKRRIRIYFGLGLEGQLAASLALLRQLESQMARDRGHREGRDWHGTEELLVRYWSLCELGRRVHGLGNHARYQPGDHRAQTMGIPSPVSILKGALPVADPKELISLLEDALQGQPSVLPALEDLLDSVHSIWQVAANLGNQLIEKLLERYAGSNLLLRESLGRKLRDLQEELSGGKEIPPLEVLLVERITIGWLESMLWDHLAVQIQEPDAVQARELRRRRDQAERRFLAAIESLHRLRGKKTPRLVSRPGARDKQKNKPPPGSDR